jgi:hypothetical protein
VELPAEFLVEHVTESKSRRAEVDSQGEQSERARGVRLCLSLGEVNKDILFRSKLRPMLTCPLQSLLVECPHYSVVLLC